MVDDLIDVTIRPAHVQDAEAIADVHASSWRQAYTGVVAEEYLAGLDVPARAAWWREQLASGAPGLSVWVAQEEGRVIGFASLGPSIDEDAERTTMQIYTIYLEPASWGHGVARELMRTILAEVPEGAPVTLWVLAANARAAHFYRRNGFIADGVERLETIGGEQYREVRYIRG